MKKKEWDERESERESASSSSSFAAAAPECTFYYQFIAFEDGCFSHGMNGRRRRRKKRVRVSGEREKKAIDGFVRATELLLLLLLLAVGKR